MSEFDIQIAARTVWAETRGEPEEGQLAVAHVLVNRMLDGRFGKSLAEVCLARKQFSCWNDNDPNRLKLVAVAENDKLLAKMLRMVRDALQGATDPSEGATHYHAISLQTAPNWTKVSTVIKQIGRHRFYRDVA